MAMIKNVEVNWVQANPERGRRFKNDKSNPEMWSVQLVTRDKAEKDRWAKEFGFKVSPMEDDNGIFYKASLSCYTRNQDGDLNKPIVSILGNADPVDPDTVGNGSVANITFSVSGEGDNRRRRWKGMQVVKWVKFKPTSDDDQFELVDDIEIIEDGDDNADY